MTANIKEIELWENNPDKSRVSRVVRVNFNFPCTWTIFNLEELEQILKLWVKGEYYRWPKGDPNRDLFRKFVNEAIDKGIKEVENEHKRNC